VEEERDLHFSAQPSSTPRKKIGKVRRSDTSTKGGDRRRTGSLGVGRRPFRALERLQQQILHLLESFVVFGARSAGAAYEIVKLVKHHGY
jgi:hypothetical protein